VQPSSIRSSLAVLALAAGLAGQVVNPADKQRPPEPTPQGPPVIVEGLRVSDLREEDRIGSYGQPEWTSHRRFAETRIYVRPEGTFEFEYWLIPEYPRDGGPVETKTQFEFEFGLPARFQLDLYLVSHQDGNEGVMAIDEQKVEVRWALADWDEIFANPTLYLEWAAINEAPDHVEAKLLLGGEVTSGWHWGANLVFEHETAGEMENVYELTGGVSYAIRDKKFSVGAEFKLAYSDVTSDRGNYANEVLIGPSFQYRPLPNAHIDLAPLFGVTDDSPDAKITVLFGWEF
jgi:outer membrane putative beta-barrel porin/alpha-amylase